MPTHEQTDRFRRDWENLTAGEAAFCLDVILRQFVPAIAAGPPYPNGLRIKGVQGAKGVWEMTWEKDDGRATFQFGEQVKAGEPHIIWRRVGGHSIFVNP